MNQSIVFGNLRPALAAVFLIFWAGTVQAAGTATTVRSADLKSMPSPSGTTIAQLAKGETVAVGQRKGAWFQVETGTQTQGWIRMLAVRYQTASTSGSLLDSLSKASRTETTVATGVRGLNKEMLSEAEPNQERLQKLLGFEYTASDARSFAAQGGLRAGEVSYP